MERRKITFEESCERPCALRLVECAGPTADGLDGYVCEKCAEFLLVNANDPTQLGQVPCGYCGKKPTYTPSRGFPICGVCAFNALETTRSWYSHLLPERD